MDKGFYLNVASNQNNTSFPDNRTSSFRLTLPKIMRLLPTGQWAIAMVEMKTPEIDPDYNTDYIRIETPECRPSVDQNDVRPVLFKAFITNATGGHIIAPSVLQYIPLATDNLHTMSFNITGSNGEEVSFKPGNLYCTLHVIQL